jgi:hypothetical protein
MPKRQPGTVSGTMIAVTAASLFIQGCATGNGSPATARPAPVECTGVNACSGMGDCRSARNVCSGHNDCKGQGWISLPRADCLARGGRPLASD